MTGVARLHCLYLAGVSVVRCQIVFTVVVYLLSVSVFQVLKLFSPGRVSVYLCPSWRLCTAGFNAPALPMISAPPLCLESAPALPAHLTSTVFWSCLIKTICFSLAIGSRAFCTVTDCCALGCVSHTYIYLWRPTTISKLFQKALLNKHEHVMHI